MMEEGSVLYVPVIKDERSKAVLPVFDFCTRLTAADYIRAQVSGVRGQGMCRRSRRILPTHIAVSVI